MPLNAKNFIQAFLLCISFLSFGKAVRPFDEYLSLKQSIVDQESGVEQLVAKLRKRWGNAENLSTKGIADLAQGYYLSRAQHADAPSYFKYAYIKGIESNQTEVILESLAMLDYIGHRYGPTDLIVKPDEADFARYLEWFQFGEAAMAISVNLLTGHTVLLPEQYRIPSMAKWGSKTVSEQLDLIASRGLQNGKRQFLAGERLTFADMSIMYMLFLLKITKCMPTPPDVISDYFNRMKATASWQTATAD